MINVEIDRMDDYDKITAHYYTLFRPNLHELILENYLSKNIKFPLGLDFGSGVGHSTIALSKFCEKAIGIEPSKDMLSKSKTHPKVSYHFYDGKNLDFQDHSFDIITLAGSLFYSKSQELYDELIRVSKPNALILLYDFEINMTNIFNALNLIPEKGNYNHKEDFSSLNLRESVVEKLKIEKEIRVSFSILESIYLLLSLRSIYETLKDKFGKTGLEEKIQNLLEINFPGNKKIEFKCKIYCTKYKCLDKNTTS